MPTRQGQIDFEQNLIEALKKTNVAETITKIILSAITNHFSEKFKYYDDKITDLENEITALKNKITDISDSEYLDTKQKVVDVEQKVDTVQQHTKNNNLRLMQIPEADNENISDKVLNIFKNKLQITVSKSDVIAIYRAGQKIGNKPRHTLVTFRDNSMKMAVYNKKKSLKGSNIVIKEDLTAQRLKAVKIASDKYGFKNVWTVNGNIFAKTENEVKKILM